MKRCPPVTKLIAEGTKVIAKRLVSSDQDAALIAVGRKVEQFEIDSYTRLCATAEKEDLTHERALLASILSQEGLAHELLGEVGAGKGPLDELVRKASLARARAR
jgi:ferritin-like metal-binding protein YciE